MDGHEFSKMDKNKSVYKLEGLPAIYWLILDADENRRFYMEEQFKYWNIENHTRIAGYQVELRNLMVVKKDIMLNLQFLLM